MSEQTQNTTPVRRFLKPMADLFVINAETMSTLILRQNELVNELIESGVETLRKTVNAETVQDAFEAQRDYVTTVSEKVQNLQRENLETLRDAGTTGTEVLRNAFRTGEAESQPRAAAQPKAKSQSREGQAAA